MKSKEFCKLVLLTLPLLLLGCSMDEDITANWENFTGNWINVNEYTSGITKVYIYAEAGTLFIHMWGKCHPTDCDWGEEKTDIADSNDNQLSIIWDQSFAIHEQNIFFQNDGKLRVETYTQYVDDSGRPDRLSTEFFSK
jgi:hypothetical protein